jgi:hypothetical protein
MEMEVGFPNHFRNRDCVKTQNLAWEIASCMYKMIPRAQLVIIKTAIF